MLPDVGILFDNGVFFGLDDIALIESIARTRSIAGAARDLGVSYSYAWGRVQELNGAFARPVVTAAVGDGASATDFGVQLCSAYRRIQQRTGLAVDDEPLVRMRPRQAVAMGRRNADR